MIKKGLYRAAGPSVAGTMISVDCSDAAVKRNRVRPRTVSKPMTQPAPTATQQTTAAPAAGGYGDRSQDDYGSCRYGHPAHYGPGHALWSDDGPRPDHGRHRSRRQRHGQRPAGRGCRPCPGGYLLNQRSVRL